MKKLLFIFFLAVASFAVMGQSTTIASLNQTYTDSITGTNLFILEDSDSTHKVSKSTLDSAFLTNPTIIGEVGIGSVNVNETELGILEGATVTTAEVNVLDGIPVGLTATEVGYLDGVTSAVQTQIDAKLNTADTLDANTQVWMLADTIVLGSFSKDTTTATGFYGSFYNGGSDTLVVTEMRAVLQGTTPSVTVDVQWHATFNSGSATDLNTTAPTITSTTTGDSDTTFDNANIPPGVWVWMETPTINTAATYISVTLCGYRKNNQY